MLCVWAPPGMDRWGSELGAPIPVFSRPLSFLRRESLWKGIAVLSLFLQKKPTKHLTTILYSTRMPVFRSAIGFSDWATLETSLRDTLS